MKKIAYSIILIGGFTLYTLVQSKFGTKFNLFDDEEGTVTPPAGLQLTDTTNNTPSAQNSTPSSTTNTTPTSTPSSTPTTPPTTTPPVTTPPKPKGQYKDGTYTGTAADAYYGFIQVKAVISGGKITDVIFLQYPNDRSTSIRINTQAMPYLKAEAIQIQSANVDGVSGASDSSQAFRESLGSALSQAKA